MISEQWCTELADRLNVWPHTPPWRAAIEAEQQVKLAQQGSRSPDDLGKSYQAIADFATMIRQRTPLLHEALSWAAFFSGFQSQKPYPEALTSALHALSYGFRASRPDAARESFRLLDRCATQGNFKLPPASDWKLDAADETSIKRAKQHLRAMRKAGASFVDAANWSTIESKAWEHADRRFRASDADSLAVSPEEMLCHLAARGPSLAWPLLFGEAPLTAWSRTLLEVADRAPESWRGSLKLHALIQLGFGGLDATRRASIERALISDASADQLAGLRTALAAVVRPQTAPVVTAPAALPVAVLFIRATSDSVSVEWQGRPARTLVIAATPGEAAHDLARLGQQSLLRALGNGVRVVVEPSTRPTDWVPATQSTALLESWRAALTLDPPDSSVLATWRCRDGAEMMIAHVDDKLRVSATESLTTPPPRQATS